MGLKAATRPSSPTLALTAGGPRQSQADPVQDSSGRPRPCAPRSPRKPGHHLCGTSKAIRRLAPGRPDTHRGRWAVPAGPRASTSA